MKRILSTLGVAAALAGALTAPAGAAESHSVSLAPLTSTWFTVELAPGEQFQGRAVLKNLLDEQVGGYLYSADGLSTPQGGFALAERSARGSVVAAWAGVSPQRIVLKPRETRMVSFTLTVPALAEPGDYTGGLVFERDRQQAVSKGDARFGLIERVGARIYLTVAGELRPSLQITKLKRTGSTFEVTVLNNGNARLTPRPSLEITSMLGRKTRITLAPKPEVLYPQQRVTYTGTWTRPGLLGRFRVAATASWDGGTASRRTSFWLIPWVLILIVLAAAVALVAGVRRGVRWLRRAKRALQQAEVATTAVAAEPVIVEPPVVEAVVAASLPAAQPKTRAHRTAPPKRSAKPASGKSGTTRRVAGTVAKPRRKQPARTGRR